MNSNSYGKTHFKHKNNYGSIVVFSDEAISFSREEKQPKSINNYINIFKDPETNQWIAKTTDVLSGEYGDFIIEAENLSPVGTIQASELTFFVSPDQETQYGDMLMDYYTIDGKLYIQANAAIALKTVEITGEKSQQIQVKPEKQLDAFVTVFVSANGAKLERAYQKINTVNTRELIIFAEKDDSTNIFGSVFRVKAGKQLDDNSIYPKFELANLLKSYTTDTSLSSAALSNLISQYYKDKNHDSVFLWLPRIGATFIKVLASVTLQPLGEAMEGIANAIDKELRLDDNRWKATINGKENTKYEPLLPGYDFVANEKNIEKYANTINNEYITPLAKPIKKLIRKLKNNTFTKHFIGNRLDGLLRFIETIPSRLESIIKSIFEVIKTAFHFFNAFLVGIINSLVDLLKSVFEILSMICKGIYSLTSEVKNATNNTGSYFTMVAEALENFLSFLASLFTLKNLEAFFAFQLHIIIAVGKLGIVAAQQITQFVTGNSKNSKDTSIAIPFDAIGYCNGYIIGWIAQEIALFMATAGTASIAKGIQGAVKSYKDLFNAIGKTVQKTAKGVQRTVGFTIETFLKFLDKLKQYAKQLPQLLEKLKMWMDELLASLTKSKVFQQFKAVLQLLEDLGVSIIKNLSPNPLVVQGVDGTHYAIKQKGKTILEGTKTAIKDFLNKINDISKSKGNSKKEVQEYLDAVSSQRKIAKDFQQLVKKWKGKSIKALKKSDISNALKGTTEQANRVAKLIDKGDISINILDEKAFIKKYTELGGTKEDALFTDAFAFGEKTYYKSSTSVDRFLSEVVHECTHAKDYIDDVKDVNNIWEKRARFYERAFQTATGQEKDFETIEELLNFINTYY